MQSPQALRDVAAVAAVGVVRGLPEVGDPEKPKLVFFFDEAHLLFDDAPKALLEKIEQVVRLIRSKGVGVYFVTQNPLDVPDTVLGQLGNRVQHALRAFTPRDQKAVQGGGGDIPRRIRRSMSKRQSRTRGRRGTGITARREGHARTSGTGGDHSSTVSIRSDGRGASTGDHQELSAVRTLREGGRSRVGV